MLLPHDIPNARIITYGYDADVVHWTSTAGQNSLREHAQNLVNDLCNHRTRTKTPKRPILFVAHSLGGLVVQDALLLCVNPSDESQATILNSARGICFLGTPNGGSDFTKFATAVANVISLSIVKRSNAQLLEVLKKRSEVLANVKNGFLTLVRRRAEGGSPVIKLHAFVEELPVAATGHRVVTSDSAIIPGYNSTTLPYDHMSMTKYLRDDDVGYQRVSGKLIDWVMEIDESNGLLKPDVLLQNTAQSTSHLEAMNDSKLGDKSLYRYPRRFGKIIDRLDIMNRMTNLLKQDGDSTKIAILYGMGGQGKTTLALNFCREAEMRHLFQAIFWLDASSEDTLSKGFVTISELVKRHEDRLFDTTDDRIRFARERIEEWNRPWLFIMDNYDDPCRLSNITSYIPNSKHGSILVTSRQANLERLGAVISVPPMSTDESLRLLYDRCGGADKYAGQHGDAVRIVEMLGHLPLAIEQAAAYIQRRVDLPLAKFVGQYKDRKDTIWSKAPIIWDYKETVYTTWEMSFELIDEEKSRRDEKGKVLTMLSFLDFRGISLELFSIPRALAAPFDAGALETPSWLKPLLKVDGNWDLLKLEDLLTDLNALSLIHLIAHKPGALEISLHPLVSEWIKYRADLETKRQCLYEAISIVKTCLQAYSKDATKLLLAMEAGDEVFRHQASCMENLRDLRRQNRDLMGQSLFVEHTATSSKANTRRAPKFGKVMWTLELDFRRVSKKHQSMLNDHDLQQKRAVLDWLSHHTSDVQYAEILTRTAESTGQWLLDTPDFEEWLSGAHQGLWVHGIPGCGKTHSASQVVKHLIQTYENSSCLFFFCNYGDGNVNNVHGILSAMVRQALSTLRLIPQQVQNSFEQHTSSQSRLALWEVECLLFAMVQSRLASANRIFIVLDALDEIEEDECRNLLKIFQKLVYTFPSSMSIMVTSRATPSFGNELANVKPIDFKIINLVAQPMDMIAYSNKRFASSTWLANLSKHHPELNEIQLAVLEHWDGMFLWAKLFMDQLAVMPTARPIRLLLKELPKSLSDIYHYSLDQIHNKPSDNGHLAVQILLWLSWATRPLRLRELQHAIFSMSLESSEVVFYHEELVDTAVLTSLCVGLVVFDEADAVQFVHYSTKEFIERERDRIYPEATNDITLSCIRYLSLQPFAAGPWPVAVIRERLLEYPFATYAAKYWVQHAKQCSETLTEKTVIGIANFLSTQKLLDSWIQILAYVEHLEDVRRGEVETQEPSLSSRLADCGTALEVARELGLDAKVQALLVHRT